MWERDLQTDDSKPALTYKRPYLIQQSTGNIITCQHKAYNDHAGVYSTEHAMHSPYSRKQPIMMLV